MKQWESRVKKAFEGELPPIIKVNHFNEYDEAIAEITRLLGKAVEYGVKVSFPASAIDDKIIKAFEEQPRSFEGQPRSFEGLVIPADHGGMSSVSFTGNFQLILLDRYGNGFTTVTFGCEHELKHIQKGNCYYQSSCSKCDYAYVIDSGD